MSKACPNKPHLSGEWRRPHNDLQHQVVGGGHKAIHDEETARQVGFAKAPIHGAVYWSQFAPLFLQAFGHSWFESGSVSVHFITPVTVSFYREAHEAGRRRTTFSLYGWNLWTVGWFCKAPRVLV